MRFSQTRYDIFVFFLTFPPALSVWFRVRGRFAVCVIKSLICIVLAVLNCGDDFQLAGVLVATSVWWQCFCIACGTSYTGMTKLKISRGMSIWDPTFLHF